MTPTAFNSYLIDWNDWKAEAFSSLSTTALEAPDDCGCRGKCEPPCAFDTRGARSTD